MPRIFALLWLFAIFSCITAFSSDSDGGLGDLRMKKRFGIGCSAAGPLSMFGIEADFNITPDFSIGTGIGTGLQYSTFMVKSRYILLGETVSPYLALGVAHWWTDGTREEKLSPSVLANKFLGPGYDATRGFSLWILSPAIGVQFLHSTGISIYAEVEYLFKLVDFSNGTYAGLGIQLYL